MTETRNPYAPPQASLERGPREGYWRVVYPKKIDQDYVQLKGCGAPFLDSLPAIPG